MAEGSDPRLRQGGCEALGHLQAEAAVPVLVRLLAHEDRWLRVKAAEAIKRLGAAAKPVVPDMLRVVADTAEPSDPIPWVDPIQLGQGELAAVLFKGQLAPVAKAADPELLHPAIRAVSRNADGMARATLRQLLEQLSADEVRALGPDILVAVQTRCPADTMFGNEIRMGGFRALVRHRFVEGIEAGVGFARTQGGHGSEWRTAEIMKELTAYGTAARPAIPKLQDLIVFFDEDAAAGRFPKALNPRRTEAVATAIAAISAATTQPELRTFAAEADAGGPRDARPRGL
jgi:hypothetical protein